MKTARQDIQAVNRQFLMETAEEGASEAGTEQPTEGLQGPQSTEKPGEKKPEPTIPKNRFDEINRKYKETQAQLEQFLAEKTEAETKAKEQQGQFEELYKTTADELTRFKDTAKVTGERVQQLEAVIGTLLEAKLATIPDEFHDLIPGTLTPEQKLEWVAAAESKGLFGVKKGDTPVGGNTNPAPHQTADLNTLSPAELFRVAYGQK